ncbi:MAG TPA: hypothetical protein VK688_13390 [Gemmatimonadales bacterium]|nr:hypothetical protein [Gemmatimonadales bacterium]
MLASVLLLAGLMTPPSGRAQAPGSAPATPGRLSDAGVYRAAALVDSVYVDRLNPEAFVEGGDFASYLVARLGVRPVPDNLAIDVAVDTTAVMLSGRVEDLPEAVRAQLGPALMFLDPSSVIAADVSLLRSRVGVMRFHLRSLLINGVALPEGILVPLMAQVGANYPALTSTGRDLLVAIPEDGTMRLAPGGVRVAVKTAGARAGTR